MVDFSSVSLKIQAPNAPEVLDVLAKIDERGQRVARNIGGAHRESLTLVSRHASLTARKVAGELSMIAAEGKVSAGALKGIATEAANAALMFGPYGAIAGAVALTGIAIFNMFSRTREEIEKTAQKAREELERIARAGDLVGAAKASQYLYSGDPFAALTGQREGETDEAYYARRVGIQGVRKRIGQIQGMLPGEQYHVKEWHALKREMDGLNEALAEMENRYNAIQPVLTSLARKEGERAKFAIETARAEAMSKYDASHTETLSKLLGGGLPSPNQLGAPVAGGFRPDLTEFGYGVRASIQDALKTAPPLPATEVTSDLERIMALDQVAESITSQIGQTLGNAIATGFEIAFSSGSIGDGFKAMTGAILSGLGTMAIEMGTAALAIAIKQKLVKDSITSFMPELGIPAAIALIAIGGTLRGIGGAMGGGGRYSGGGGGYAGAAAPVIYSVNPAAGPNTAGLTAAQPVNIYSPVFLSPTDPTWQRQLRESIRLAEARG